MFFSLPFLAILTHFLLTAIELSPDNTPSPSYISPPCPTLYKDTDDRFYQSQCHVFHKTFTSSPDYKTRESNPDSSPDILQFTCAQTQTDRRFPESDYNPELFHQSNDISPFNYPVHYTEDFSPTTYDLENQTIPSQYPDLESIHEGYDESYPYIYQPQYYQDYYGTYNSHNYYSYSYEDCHRSLSMPSIPSKYEHCSNDIYSSHLHNETKCVDKNHLLPPENVDKTNSNASSLNRSWSDSDKGVVNTESYISKPNPPSKSLILSRHYPDLESCLEQKDRNSLQDRNFKSPPDEKHVANSYSLKRSHKKKTVFNSSENFRKPSLLQKTSSNTIRFQSKDSNKSSISQLSSHDMLPQIRHSEYPSSSTVPELRFSTSSNSSSSSLFPTQPFDQRFNSVQSDELCNQPSPEFPSFPTPLLPNETDSREDDAVSRVVQHLFREMLLLWCRQNQVMRLIDQRDTGMVDTVFRNSF